MSSVYSNIADNTGSVKVWVSVDVSSISRTDNTVTINGLQLEHWTPTAGAYDSPVWLGDCEWPRGTLRLSASQSKGITGSTILTNTHYFTGSTSFSYSCNTGDSSTEINTRIQTDGVWKAWVDAQWGQVFIGIPTVSAPSTPSASVSGIAPTSASINASVASAGNNCTFTSLLLEYGKTTSYGSSQSSGSQTNTFSLTGLTPGTTYYYRLTATNGAGLTTQSTGSFVTQAVPGMIPVLMAMM